MTKEYRVPISKRGLIQINSLLPPRHSLPALAVQAALLASDKMMQTLLIWQTVYGKEASWLDLQEHYPRNLSAYHSKHIPQHDALIEVEL